MRQLLVQLFLMHRYSSHSVHYVNPTADNEIQTKGMTAMGIYTEANTEIGDIIAATVNRERVKHLISPDQVALKALTIKAPDSPSRA